MSRTDDADRSFPAALRAGVRPLDLVAIVAVPLVLLAVFALPEPLRRSLAFSYGDPTLWTAFTANYVHLGSDHLLANLLTYGLVVTPVYVLSVLAGRRTRFLVAFTTFVLAFPIALSLLNLAVWRPGGTVGFSGVTMAFVGFLPMALAGFLSVRFDLDGELDLAAALFFGGMALVATLVVQSVVTDAVAVIAVLSAILFVRSAVVGQRRRPDLRAAVETRGYLELAAVALVLFAGLQVLAFPSDPAAGGAIVNLYVHLLGYALGFTSTYATVHLVNRVAATPTPPTESPPDWRPGEAGDPDAGPHVAID